MRIAVVTPVVRDRDAVGTDTVEMIRALRARGHEVRLFGESVKGVSERSAGSMRAVEFASAPGDALIYHFSFGWPGAGALMRAARCRTFVKYHNVTPPEFFRGYSDAFVAACDAGRRQIPEIVALGCERYLADSEYNLQELLDAGLDPARGAVVPPFHRSERLIDTPADLRMLERFLRRDRTNVLMVGRLAPNKGHVALVQAFAEYRRRFDATARLIVVGKADARLAGYSSRITQEIQAQGLAGQVEFLEDVSDSELKALYLSADALLMLSEHEGFCVPLAEAMALQVPVVARAATAMPATVGDAGLLLADATPAAAAEALQRLRREPGLRETLVARGLQRHRTRYASAAIAAGLAAPVETAA